MSIDELIAEQVGLTCLLHILLYNKYIFIIFIVIRFCSNCTVSLFFFHEQPHEAVFYLRPKSEYTALVWNSVAAVNMCKLERM